MSNETKPTPTAAPQSFTDCPNWGKGGRYVLDITNGQRVPLDKLPADAQAALTKPDKEQVPVATKSTKSTQEKKRA